MLNIMNPLNTTVLLRNDMCNIMQALRTNKKTLLAITDVFVHDPLVEWYVFNGKVVCLSLRWLFRMFVYCVIDFGCFNPFCFSCFVFSGPTKQWTTNEWKWAIQFLTKWTMHYPVNPVRPAAEEQKKTICNSTLTVASTFWKWNWTGHIHRRSFLKNWTGKGTLAVVCVVWPIVDILYVPSFGRFICFCFCCTGI